MEELVEKEKKTILVVDDEKSIMELLVFNLQKEGYNTLEAYDGVTAVEMAINEKPDLILLDVILPNESGISICQQLRENNKTPIIFVTSKNSSMDELECMTLGGDDFIAKPYDPLVLLAHIAAVLKRTSIQEERILRYKKIELDILAAKISYQNKQIDLSKNELNILTYLFCHQEQVVSRDELMNNLWGNGNFIDDNTLSINISRIRQKLKEINIENLIITKRGLGYQMLLKEGENNDI